MDDSTSRQAAIDALIEWYGCEPDDMDYFVKILARKSSAQPKRKKGKWKLNKDGNWACPFCKFDPYHDNMKGMNYCPNCAAKME